MDFVGNSYKRAILHVSLLLPQLLPRIERVIKVLFFSRYSITAASHPFFFTELSLFKALRFYSSHDFSLFEKRQFIRVDKGTVELVGGP